MPSSESGSSSCGSGSEAPPPEQPGTIASIQPRSPDDLGRGLQELEARYQNALQSQNARARRELAGVLIGCLAISMLSPVWKRWLRRVTAPALRAAWSKGRSALSLVLVPIRLMLTRPVDLLLHQLRRRGTSDSPARGHIRPRPAAAGALAAAQQRAALAAPAPPPVADAPLPVPVPPLGPAAPDLPDVDILPDADILPEDPIQAAEQVANAVTKQMARRSTGGRVQAPRGVVLISRPSSAPRLPHTHITNMASTSSSSAQAAGSCSPRTPLSRSLASTLRDQLQQAGAGPSTLLTGSRALLPLGPVEPLATTLAGTLPTLLGDAAPLADSSQGGATSGVQQGSLVAPSDAGEEAVLAAASAGPSTSSSQPDAAAAASSADLSQQVHTAPAGSGVSLPLLAPSPPLGLGHGLAKHDLGGRSSALPPHLDPSQGGGSGVGGEGGLDVCASEVMSVASFRSDTGGGAGDGMGTGDGAGSASDGVGDGEGGEGGGEVGEGEGGLEAEGDGAGEASFLGLPACVGAHVLSCMDADGIRVLRLVCRSLYWEASRGVRCLVVTPENLETLVAMQVHALMPCVTRLMFRQLPPLGARALPTGASPGPHPPFQEGRVPSSPLALLTGGPSGMLGSVGLGGLHHHHHQHQSQALGQFNSSVADSALLMRFIHEVVPQLKELRVVDLSEAPLHVAPTWPALLDALPGPHTRIVLREHTAWARGAMGLLGTPESLRDSADHYPELLEAIKRAVKHSMARTLERGQACGVTIDLMGVTVRRNTAARLPQLCGLQCLTSLTLFGKSAAAATHGHRLAGHLSAVAALRHLTRLELLSYEDVSDAELAPLAACPSLKHLYLDSLFIKQASGPIFPSLTSLTAARIKFILRPLTTIFPALTHLRLGVLHSELNKKISSASLSCLAGCTPQLTHLCVCPVLWKGQWQVLPTLDGLTTLQLVHCRDLSHLREVLRVVGRSASLLRLELHAASPAVPAWPGAAGDAGDAGGGMNGPAGVAAAEVVAAAAAAAAAAVAAGADPEDAAAAAAVVAAAVADEAGAEAAGSVADANLYAGLAGSGLRSLVIAECSGRLVRHLVGAELPQLSSLELRGMAGALRVGDLQAAVLALPQLTHLSLQAPGEGLSAAQAMGLPGVLARPGLTVEWRSTCDHASLLFARDCGAGAGGV